MTYHNVRFGRAVDYLRDLLGIGSLCALSRAGSCLTMEVHVHTLYEASRSNVLEQVQQPLDYDKKQLPYFQQMHHKGKGCLAASSEQSALHDDSPSPRISSTDAELANGNVSQTFCLGGTCSSETHNRHQPKIISYTSLSQLQKKRPSRLLADII